MLPLCPEAYCLPGQNVTWVKFWHFCPKNDDEKWSRIFEIERAPSELLLPTAHGKKSAQKG